MICGHAFQERKQPNILNCKRGYWGIAARAYRTLVMIAAVSFVWFLNQWNLLGWRY